MLGVGYKVFGGRRGSGGRWLVQREMKGFSLVRLESDGKHEGGNLVRWIRTGK